MMKLEQYTKTRLDDGRRTELFGATCKANRNGWSRERIEKELIDKAVNIDGMEHEDASSIVNDALDKYGHEFNKAGEASTGTSQLDDSSSKHDWSWACTSMPHISTSPENQFKEYINAVFKPGDYIAVDADPKKDDDTDKITPTKPTRVFKLDSLDSVCADLLKTRESGKGAFVIVNPVNSFFGGKSDKDVSDYRHLLLESDHMEIEQQITFLKEMNFPLSAIVYSGGKSVHGIMRIDAGRDYDLYKKRVAYVFKIIEMHNVYMDTACKNPNRWSRLPGYMRHSKDIGSQQQTLLGTNWGAISYDEWEEEMIKRDNQINDVFDFAKDDIPEPKDELIAGLIRMGGKMLVCAPPKKGKSLLQMQLAMSLTNGMDWLGFPCKRSRVLYCSLEGDHIETIHRMDDIGKAMNITDKSKYPLIQNLNRATDSIEKLSKSIIADAKRHDVEVIFIDPIYTLLGDEISSAEVKKLLQAIEHINWATGAAVIFCHHSNKGSNSTNRGNQLDQVSGSGCFGRYPDAIITINRNLDDKGKLLFTTRGFKDPEPIDTEFSYPIVKRKNDQPRPSGRRPSATDEEIISYLKAHPDSHSAHLSVDIRRMSCASAALIRTQFLARRAVL